MFTRPSKDGKDNKRNSKNVDFEFRDISFNK